MNTPTHTALPSRTVEEIVALAVVAAVPQHLRLAPRCMDVLKVLTSFLAPKEQRWREVRLRKWREPAREVRRTVAGPAYGAMLVRAAVLVKLPPLKRR